MSFFIVLICFGYTMILLGLAMPALQYRPHPATRVHQDTDQFYIAQATKSDKFTGKPLGFTVIVVYRNEILRLPKLLKSIAALDYPTDSMEFVLVNDQSSDGSEELLVDFQRRYPALRLQLLQRPVSSNSAKKDGITAAIAQSKFEHIITTDADCNLPSLWLQAYNKHYQLYPGALLVAGPVQFLGDQLVGTIQQLEMVALQTITAGAFAMRQPFMCNGANLSFKRQAFTTVGGFSGNQDISSGDDVFLLEKLAAEDVLQCHYLKDTDAIVTTDAQCSWRDMVQQRARWAKKGNKTKSLLNKLVAFHVAAMSLLFVVAPVLYAVDVIALPVLISIYSLKFFTDFIVLLIGNQLMKIKQWGFHFLIHFIMYPIIVIMIGIKSLGTIEWHGRVIDQPTD
jgi:cellulose synthase/poly-beta-1,6-N-acetylglucosamine synthase-like glycosyltransferase